MAVVNSNGVDIHYDVYRNGTRPWIVFAHGAGGNAASWWQQVPYFYDDYNIVTFDHRSFGRSRCSQAEFGADHFVDDLRAILDVVDIQRAALVCQSMGGRMGLGLAIENPERVTALVMSHTVGGLSNDAIVAARGAGTRPDPAEPFGSWAVALDLPEKNPALSHLYNRIGAFNVDFASFGGTASLRGGAGIDPAALDGYSVPTLYVTADNDLVIPPAVVEIGVALTPGAELVNLGDAGHSSYFEIAADFNEVVAAFLTRVS